MTLQQLEYIVALDIHRQFVKAAEHCNVTQPTITTQVRKLEEEIGFDIFDRSRNPLKPTAMGTMVIHKARSIINETRELKDFVNDERESIAGEYRIGIIPTVSPYIAPELVRPFSGADSECHLHVYEMQTETIITKLHNEEIDLGILVTPIDDPGIREIPLYYEPFVAYCSPSSSLKSKSILALEDVEGQDDLWLLSNGHCFRNQVLNICNPSERTRGFQYEIGSFETVKKMVKLHGGHTLIPELAIDEADKDFVIPFSQPQPVREVSIVVNKSFYKEGLIDHLRKEILGIIPKSFNKNERFIRIKWR